MSGRPGLPARNIRLAVVRRMTTDFDEPRPTWYAALPKLKGRWIRCPETVTESVPLQAALAHEILIESNLALGPRTANLLTNFSLGAPVKVTVVDVEETAR